MNRQVGVPGVAIEVVRVHIGNLIGKLHNVLCFETQITFQFNRVLEITLLTRCIAKDMLLNRT